MTIKLYYDMMADAVYALAALAVFENGGEKVIGRDEEGALMSRFRWALVDVCLQLGPAVRMLRAQTGEVELVASGELVHRALESAVLQRVLAELGLETEETAREYLRILKSTVNYLPYLQGYS